MVAEGYKKTDVGLIPLEWEVCKVVDIINKTDGIKIGPFGSQLKKELLRNSGYKVYGQENVYGKNMEIGDRYISKNHFSKLKSCKINQGDFLISMMGTIGKCMIAPHKFQPGIMDSHLIRLRLDKSKLNVKLLLHFFESDLLINQVNKYSVGGIMDGLSSKIVKQIQLPLPPTLAEQTAIATALSDTDELITSLEKLIAKKKAIKQGAMQELLKPKDGWIEIKLKAIVSEFIVPMRDKPKKFGGKIPWCRIEDFDGKYLTSSRSNRFVDEITISSMNLKVMPQDTLIVSCSADLGRCAILKKALVTNQTFIGLVINESTASNEFLYYFFSHYAWRLNQLSTGTTISYLSRLQFEELEISIPNSLKEQIQIANILSVIDNEIIQLGQKLEKQKLIKQGMMQSLLTGKIRLI